MFEKKKTKEELQKEKERAKLKKAAQSVVKEQELKKKRAERILDKDFVEKRLGYERKKDEKKAGMRDTYIQEVKAEVLSGEKDTFTCSICGEEIGLGNITCPRCGQLYCQYCGYKLDMENFTGKCPKCQGFAQHTPAKLVQTRIEDIPEEDRFWEQLNECPKCGGATQPEWDSCPICGAKLKAPAPKGPTAAAPEKTIKSIKEQRKEELMKRRRQQQEKGPKRGI